MLIFDEVQTGMGRTGKYFGYQHFDVVPDIMTLAKALGGGTPIGALVAKPEVAAKFVPGTHASTFGGNPLVTAAGIAVIEAIDEDEPAGEHAGDGRIHPGALAKMAKRLKVIRQVRGTGLMIGIELSAKGADIVKRCMKKGCSSTARTATCCASCRR